VWHLVGPPGNLLRIPYPIGTLYGFHHKDSQMGGHTQTLELRLHPHCWLWEHTTQGRAQRPCIAPCPPAGLDKPWLPSPYPQHPLHRP